MMPEVDTESHSATFPTKMSGDAQSLLEGSTIPFSSISTPTLYHLPVCVWDAIWCLLDWRAPSALLWCSVQVVLPGSLRRASFDSRSSSSNSACCCSSNSLLTKGFSSSAQLQLPSQSTKSSDSSLSSITSNTKHAEPSGTCHFRSMLMCTSHFFRLSAILIS